MVSDFCTQNCTLIRGRLLANKGVVCPEPGARGIVLFMFSPRWSGRAERIISAFYWWGKLAVSRSLRSGMSEGAWYRQVSSGSFVCGCFQKPKGLARRSLVRRELHPRPLPLFYSTHPAPQHILLLNTYFSSRYHVSQLVLLLNTSFASTHPFTEHILFLLISSFSTRPFT